MANLTPASKARCLGVFPCGEGATGEQVASATAGHGQQAARGTQIFSSSRSHSVNCRMIPFAKRGGVAATYHQTPEKLHLLEAVVQQTNNAIVITTAELEHPGPQTVYGNSV